MRQKLIEHYRGVYLSWGCEKNLATLYAIDEADSDLRDMNQAELGVYLKEIGRGRN